MTQEETTTTPSDNSNANANSNNSSDSSDSSNSSDSYNSYNSYDSYDSYDNPDSSDSSDSSDNPDSSDSPDSSNNPDSSDSSDSSDSPDSTDSSDSPDSPDSSDNSDSNLPMISMVMKACIGLIDGRTTDDELRQLLDALRAHELIEELSARLAEAESRHQTELDALRAEYERKVTEAYSAGEIAGRNAVITETLTTPEMISTLPRLDGSANPRRQHPNSIFDLAATAR